MRWRVLGVAAAASPKRDRLIPSRLSIPEHKEYLQGKQREGARNRFNLVEQDVVNAMGTTVDAQVQPPPREIESTQRGAGVVEGHVEAGGAEGCNEAAAAVETVADVDSEVVPGTPVHAG